MMTAHQALCITLIVAIILTGAFAINLTRIHVQLTVAFGNEIQSTPEQQATATLANQIPSGVLKHVGH